MHCMSMHDLPISTCADTCGGTAFQSDGPLVANGTTVGLAVLKLPRVGSTWLKAEMNLLPGVFLEVLGPWPGARQPVPPAPPIRASRARPAQFEPLTDGKHKDAWCGANFTNAVLRRMLVGPQHCVNRKMISHECFWTKQQCDPDRIRPRVLASKPTLEVSGFLIHPYYVPAASWPHLAPALGEDEAASGQARPRLRAQSGTDARPCAGPERRQPRLLPTDAG